MKLPVVRYEVVNFSSKKVPEDPHLSIIFEQLLDFRHPTHIESFGEVAPCLAPRLTNKAPVFSREADLVQMAEVLFEEPAITPGDDENEVLRILRKFLERFESCLRRNRRARYAYDGGECPLESASIHRKSRVTLRAHTPSVVRGIDRGPRTS